jgi:hypothetical protein
MTRLIFGLILFLLTVYSLEAKNKPRVFIFTDINIDSGDPDDRQSLIHLLWYANEVQIEGVVPDRWEAKGLEACELVIDAYAKDYKSHQFRKKEYPKPNKLSRVIAKDTTDAVQLFKKAASDTSSPLYVLVWGNMRLFSSILLAHAELAENIRLITIGTGLMMEKDIQYMPTSWEKSPPCQQLNWNGFGRNAIYESEQFDDHWWLEINWTYAGMFTGDVPTKMFEELSTFGDMGKHIKEVVKNEDWAQYFRAGDTPSLLYVLDRDHNADDPTESSWAGRFIQPFPEKRPNYYTDRSDSIKWNYNDPCMTWENHEQVQKVAMKTLEDERGNMYAALMKKLKTIYE